MLIKLKERRICATDAGQLLVSAFPRAPSLGTWSEVMNMQSQLFLRGLSAPREQPAKLLARISYWQQHGGATRTLASKKVPRVRSQARRCRTYAHKHRGATCTLTGMEVPRVRSQACRHLHRLTRPCILPLFLTDSALNPRQHSAQRLCVCARKQNQMACCVH